MNSQERQPAAVSPAIEVRATPELIAALGAALAAGRHDLSSEDRFELEALRLQAMASVVMARAKARAGVYL